MLKQETKVYGSIRKTKRYGACGVILALAALSLAGQASADEVTSAGTGTEATIVRTDNPATNLPETQPTSPQGLDDAVSKAGQVSGDITTPVENSGLDQSVAQAQADGAIVEQSSNVHVKDTLAEAEQDLANQKDKVEKVGETAKEVSATKAEAEKNATAAGVVLDKDKNEKTYTDNNKAALDDAKAQAGTLETAADAQLAISKDLSHAKNEAEQAGVDVKTGDTTHYKDTQVALKDLSEQTAKLLTAKDTQREIDAALALAVANLKKSGVATNDLNQTVAKTYDSFDLAKEDLAKQLAQVAEAILAQTKSTEAINNGRDVANGAGVKIQHSDKVLPFNSVEELAKFAKEHAEELITAANAMREANKAIEAAATEASSKNTPVKHIGTETVTAQELAAKQAEILKVIQDVISKNKAGQAAVDKENAEIAKFNQAELDKVKAVETENDAIRDRNMAGKAKVDAENAAIRERNAQAQADVDKENAEIRKRNQEQVDNRQAVEAENAAIKKRNEENKAKVEEENAAIKSRNEAGQKAVDAKNSEIAKHNQTQSNNVKAIEAENAAIQKRNEENKAKVDAENAPIIAYNKDAEAHNKAEKERFEKEKAEAEKNRNTDGYLSEVVSNDLIYKREANVDNVIIEGAYRFINPSDEAVNKIKLWSYDPAYYLKDESKLSDSQALRDQIGTESGGFGAPSYWLVAKKGQTVKITYDGLDNSSYGDKKISKVVYELTPVKTEGNLDDVVIQVMKDPTLGFKYGSLPGSVIGDLISGKVADSDSDYYSKANKLKVTYYDESGKAIDMKDSTAYLAAGSRNGANGKGEYFQVNSPSKFIPVTGSSIGLVGNKAIAVTDQKKYPQKEWDTETSDKQWYGSAAFEVKGNALDFEFGTIGASGQEWFTFSSELYASTVTPMNILPLKQLKEFTPEPLKPVTPADPQNPETFTPEKLKEFTPESLKDVPPVTPEPEKTFTPESEKTFTPEKTKELPKPDHKDPISFTPETAEYKTLVISAGTQDVQLSTQLHPITTQVLTHDIQMHADVHDVKVKTTVNAVEVKQVPSSHKDVINIDDEDINGHLVPKGSTVVWKLKDAKLIGGRDFTESYVREDYLDSGLEYDEALTKEKSKGWVVIYDEKTRLVTYTLNAEELEKLNDDLTTSYTAPVSYLAVKVLNDGATYKDSFTTNIVTNDSVIRDHNGKKIPNGKRGTVVVHSNVPKVYTPGSEYRNYNGNVVVRYYTEEGGTPVKIAGDFVDTEDAPVGTGYDTTDHKPEKIAHNGFVYKLTQKVVGAENGKVVDGTTYVDYYYEKVPVEPDKGNVYVHYKDEEGHTIHEDVEDTPLSPTGTPYDTTDHKPKTITTKEGITYELVPEKTQGKENGKVVEGTTEITYVYKRVTPKPATPTPHDNLILPKKKVTNAKGDDIDGKVTFQGQEINYRLTQDFDQYKDMVVDKVKLSVPAVFVDDYQEGVLDFKEDKFWIDDEEKDTDGKNLNDLFTMYHVLSRDTLSEELNKLLDDAGIKPEKEFYMWVAKNPEKFARDYMLKGISLHYTLPATVKAVGTDISSLGLDKDGNYSNTVYQIDFGNGYYGNTVVNHIPVLTPKKEVFKAGQDVNKGTVQIGEEVEYALTGVLVPANRSENIWEYVHIDDYDGAHDELVRNEKGELEYSVYALVDFTAKDKDGKELKFLKGDELKQYGQLIEYDDNGNKMFKFVFNRDFLESIADDSEFGSGLKFKAKRIAAGDVVNKYTNRFNGVDYKADDVVTHTREPYKPQTLKASEVSKEETHSPVLPKTGDSNSLLSVLIGSVMGALGFAGMRNKKKG